jgi:hypothetical protein
MAHIEFTDNYTDLSTETGFQFKFFCESCHNGYMSSWKANKSGIAGGLVRGAADIFGGIFGRAAAGSYEIQKLIGGPAHDHALEEAVNEIRPLFIQCKRCGQWVCQEVCWNKERALCKTCAPILQRELASKQAELTVEQAEQKLREQDLTEGINISTKATVVCPNCNAEIKGGKFCPECGHKLDSSKQCAQCGATMTPNDKFCPECGTKR